MLLLDLAHLGMPALRELVQTVIDFAPDTRCARHFAVDRRIEQTPQTLFMEGAKDALRDQHDDRDDQCSPDADEHAKQRAQNSKQHDRHNGTRPDDVHVLAIEEKTIRAAIGSRGAGVQTALTVVLPLKPARQSTLPNGTNGYYALFASR